MKLSKNFTRSEFKCQCGCCDYDTVDMELVNVLQDVRDHFNKPVKITSANRCPCHNEKVGGSDNSYHPRGRAADIQVLEVEPKQVQAYLLKKYPGKYGIGSYATFTHIDTRTGKGRWHG